MGKNVENPLFSPPELATLTATIMHAWFGPPVDVQGSGYLVVGQITW